MSKVFSRGYQAASNYLVVTLRELVTVCLGLFSRALFIKTIGIKYVGITGLFSSIISAISLFNLGIGSSLVYVMIPIVGKNETERIQAIFNYSKKLFRLIFIILMIIGFAIMPFLGFLVTEDDRVEHLYVCYSIYLFSSLITYISASHSAIFSAYQKMRVTELATLFGYIVTTIAQITLMLVYPSYIIFLLMNIAGNTFSVIYIRKKFHAEFKHINNKIFNITNEDKQTLLYKVRDVFITRLSITAVDITDAMLISRFEGITMLGIYSNYTLIFSNLRNLAKNAYNSMESGLGSLSTVLKKEALLTLYKRELFGFHSIGIVLTTCSFCLIQDFMTLFAGGQNLLPLKLVVVILIELYLNIIMYALTCCYNTSDYYSYIKYIYLSAAAINIIISVLLGRKYGLFGIFIGTLVSRGICILPALIALVFEKILEVSMWKGFMINGFYILQAFVIVGVMVCFTRNITVDNICGWIVKSAISLFGTVALLFVINIKNEELKYFKNRYIHFARFIKRR